MTNINRIGYIVNKNNKEIKVYSKLGYKLKQARELKNLSQKTLAKETKIGYSYISDFENGRRIPTKEQIEILENFLNIKLED